LRGVVLLGLAAVAGACTVASVVEQPTTGECVVHGVSVSPAETTIRVGETLQAVASLPECGSTMTPQFVWRSSDPAVATVDSLGGLVRALRRGSASIIAVDAREPAITGAMALQVAP
jgi:uncharacterized protein YjdB